MSLDKITADERAKHIRKNSITYNVNVIVHSDQYFGLTEITFYLEDTNFTQLKIDFTGTLLSVIVNTINGPVITQTSNFVVFGKKYLQKGRNRITVRYVNKYDTDKLGFATFQDDEHNQYVYTQFEPYAAHKAFPCFDQPNLKATFKLSIVTPTQWIAISNQLVASSGLLSAQKYKKEVGLCWQHSKNQFELFLQNVKDDTNLTHFQTTDTIPTYIFGFCAGPYLKKDFNEGKIPMSIYGMQTSKLLLQSYEPFIFDVTQKVIAFYESFFGVKYPFSKYDQVFVKDHWFSAMQNAGMVVFDEYKSLKINPTIDNYFKLAQLIAHEASHHWFGNLVTMEWWDDLWLNESFAEFISFFAIEKINSKLQKPLNPAGIYFRNSKSYGYEADELDNATHPIRGDVPDTDVAQSIFDPITYEKGAATLKQLMFLVSEDSFSAAISNYFNVFAWSNANINDFLMQFEPYFPTTVVDIDTWQKTWLQSASLNVIEAIWDPTKTSSSETLSLYQSIYSPTFDTLRCHCIQVAFFDKNCNKVETQKVLIDPKVSPTVVTYDGRNNIAAVLVNYNDYGFFQNYIDYVSLSFFKSNLNKISDDFTRSLVWFNLSALVKQTLVRVDQFATLIQVHLFEEQVNYILDRMLIDLLNYLQNYADSTTQVTFKQNIFDQIYLRLQDPQLDDFDRIKVLSQHYIKYADTDQQVLKLRDWLYGNDPNLINLPLTDNNLSWQVVKKVFGVTQSILSVDQKYKVLKYVYASDPSANAQGQKLVCQAIIARVQGTYNEMYDSLKLVDGLTSSQRQLLAQGLTDKFNYDLYNSVYRAKYFADIADPNIYSTLSYNNYEIFYESMKPTDWDYADQLIKYQKVVDALQKVESMAAHVVNFKKIMDNLALKITNSSFNADSNLTLTYIRAQQRSSYVVSESISYNCHIGYTGLESQPVPTYTGFTEMNFSLSNTPKLLPVDFQSALIKGIIVNGHNIVAEAAQNGIFIVIPRVFLQQNSNVVTICYENIYNNDGQGCMAYIDDSVTPSQHYIYTKFEPYAAHFFIPCFDQPDLKGIAQFNAIAPETWSVISNTFEIKQGTYSQTNYMNDIRTVKEQNLLLNYLEGKNGQYCVFKQTKLLPTYLFTMAAGDYYSKQLPIDQQYNQIPMTLYSLASYKDALQRNAAFIFQITKRSLKYYEDNFKVGYPFQKYDSVFCHQYSGGAMETPGMVTYNDKYLYNEEVTLDKMVYFGNLIAHECAHHWFGNLVSVKWWDDLWLKQSFANFMAYYFMESLANKSLTNIPTFSSSWAIGIIYIVEAYRQDQMLSTTHSVRTDVVNTSLAPVYFDAITYRKGETILKQLVLLMQQTNFFLGLQDYFATFAYKNTDIDDFLTSLRPYFPTSYPFNLDQWKTMWILEPSMNVLTTSWIKNSSSPNATLFINQQNYDKTGKYQQLRYHYVNISFFANDGTFTTEKVLIKDTPQTTVQYDASKGVAAILVNDAHDDFVKVRFDTDSEDFFKQNINKINNIMTRMVIYFYLNEEVRDGLVRVADHVTSTLSMIANEPQDTAYNFVFNFLNEATGSYIQIPQRQPLRETIFDFVLGQLTNLNLKLQKQQQLLAFLQNTKGKLLRQYGNNKFLKSKVKQLRDTQSRIVQLSDLLPSFCSNEDQIEVLQQWRTKNYTPLSNILISPTQAWQVIKLIYTSTRYTSSQRLRKYNQQQQQDSGVYADLVKNTCLALQATQNTMDVIYNLFLGEIQSISIKSSLAEGWNNVVHLQLLQDKYKDLFFDDLLKVSKTLPRKHFEFFYTSVKPIDDEIQDTIDRFSKINLPGSEMVGNMIQIRRIIEVYKVRLNLSLLNK